MSGVLWCDKGDHPFSVKDVNKQHFVSTHTVPKLTGNSYGTPTYQDRQEIVEEIDICGPHWLNDNPFDNESKVLTTAEVEAEESEVEMWQRRFEAEQAKNRRLLNQE
jgi:hypothetical protein